MSIKLEDVTRMALVLQQSPGSPRSPGSSRGGRRRQHQELARRLRAATGGAHARDAAAELSAITSVDELEIDYDSTLGMKRGDLAIIAGETFRCNPKAPHLADCALILKRLDCVDRRTFDQKWYEIDTFSRFRGHPNIISLYSYWKEKPTTPYVYKTIVMLEEEGIMGDMLTTVVRSKTRPSERLALKWCCDIAKALVAVHNCQIIHTRIKPSAIFLDMKRNAMVGEFGKLEVDVARRTHKLFSKILIGAAIPHTLVYWAPELLKLESYSLPVDIWALGVTLYQIVTGELPFDTANEENFRDDVLTASVDWSRLEGYHVIGTIIENCLRVDPDERWTANQVLAVAQQEFAVEVQRIWRGFKARKNYEDTRHKVIKLQAVIRGFLVSTAYRRNRAIRREQAATDIKATYRGWRDRQEYEHIRACFLKCQANVVKRQCQRAYLHFKYNVIRGQSVVRRFLVMRWFRKVKSARLILENKLRTLQSMVIKYRDEANELTRLFSNRRAPAALSYLESLETYELSIPADLLGESGAALPRLRAAEGRVRSLQSDVQALNQQLDTAQAAEKERQRQDEELKQELDLKYPEWEPMVQSLRRNLKRVAQQCHLAEPLRLAIQHPYSYSKWDQVHEPHNVVDNVLLDDESVYRTVSPEIDLTLADGSLCFVSEVEVHSGEPAPMAVEVYTSSSLGDWTLLSVFQCTRDLVQRFLLPGEQRCKYVRLRFPNNVRGGSIVSIRKVVVIGLVKPD